MEACQLQDLVLDASSLAWQRAHRSLRLLSSLLPPSRSGIRVGQPFRPLSSARSALVRAAVHKLSAQEGLSAGILSQTFGPRDWATKRGAASDLTSTPAYLQALR